MSDTGDGIQKVRTSSMGCAVCFLLSVVVNYENKMVGKETFCPFNLDETAAANPFAVPNHKSPRLDSARKDLPTENVCAYSRLFPEACLVGAGLVYFRRWSEPMP